MSGTLSRTPPSGSRPVGQHRGVVGQFEMGPIALDVGPNCRDHPARCFNITDSKRRAHGAAICPLSHYVHHHRRRRMGRSPCAKILHGVNVGDSGKVLIGVRAAVLGGVTLSPDGASDEQLPDSVAVAVVCESEGVWIDAHFNAVDQQRLGVRWGRHETDVPKVQSVNGSLERLDGFYGPAGVISDQGAVGRVIPPRLKVCDCGRRQPVGVFRCDQTCGDAAARVLILDNQRTGVAGVFRSSEDTELGEL